MAVADIKKIHYNRLNINGDDAQHTSHIKMIIIFTAAKYRLHHSASTRPVNDSGISMGIIDMEILLRPGNIRRRQAGNINLR